MSEINATLSAFAGLISAALCWRAMPIAASLNLLDIPDDRKKHVRITPLMGGIVLLLAFIPAALVLTFLVVEPVNKLTMFIWLAVTAGMTLVGIADDRHSLSPKMRLLLSFCIFGAAAFIEPIFNVRVLDFEFPPFTLGLGNRAFAIAFTMLCCVGLVNAVNMADGKNGLVLGLCLGWLGLLLLRAPEAFHPFIILLMCILAVLCAFNMQGKLFLGDGGAYGLASAVGVMAIMTYNSPGEHATRALAGEDVMLLFAVPVLDSFRLTIKRLRRGLSPMAADRDHFHHHLLNRFGWPGGLLVYLMIAFAVGGAKILFF